MNLLIRYTLVTANMKFRHRGVVLFRMCDEQNVDEITSRFFYSLLLSCKDVCPLIMNVMVTFSCYIYLLVIVDGDNVKVTLTLMVGWVSRFLETTETVVL